MTDLATRPLTDDTEFRNRISPEVFASPILIADDQTLNLNIISAYLRKIGFTNLDVATDGDMALEKVRANRPDLLILDIMMPRTDGYSVCRTLRADPEFADLPILVQTALKDVHDRVEIFRAGATDLIVKPVNRLELIARAGVHLERRLLIRSLRQTGERIERELQAARDMQNELLPTLEQEGVMLARGLDVASMYTTSSELGGDFWGMIDTEDGKPGFYVADFAGHGVMAALNTVRLHTLIKQLPPVPPDPAMFLRLLNDALARLLPIGQFATATCVFFDPAEGTLSYASAGSTAPLLHLPDGAWQLLDSAGVPLGIMRGAAYTTRTQPFPPDALLFLYSDGFAESPLDTGERLGEDGICTLADDAPRDDAKCFLDDVVERFRARLNRPPIDDLTGIAVRRTDGALRHASSIERERP